MNKKVLALSIFFPFWNEEKNIEKVIKNAIPVAEKVAEKWEIIAVDDGSSDRTLEIAEKLAKAIPILHILMNLLKIWDFVFFGFMFRDIDCGFKMFKKEALKRILPFKSEGAMITTEILAKAKRAKLKISQAEVTHYPRIYGDQSGGNLRVIVRAIRESFILWKDLNYGSS